MTEINAVFSFGIALGAGMASIVWGVFLFFIMADKPRAEHDEFRGDQF